MIVFKATFEDIAKWFPEESGQFIQELRDSSSKNSKFKAEKTDWIVSWGFFVKKAKSEEEQTAQRDLFMNKLKMVYSERVEVELPKIRINLSMKAGQYLRGDKVYSETPDFITQMAREVVKVMMWEEQKQLQDPIVLESLEEFKHLFEESEPSETPLDLDTILDKINTTGMSSLTGEELKFLEKMSKGN